MYLFFMHISLFNKKIIRPVFKGDRYHGVTFKVLTIILSFFTFRVKRWMYYWFYNDMSVFILYVCTQQVVEKNALILNFSGGDWI